jgi:hypothetical protein
VQLSGAFRSSLDSTHPRFAIPKAATALAASVPEAEPVADGADFCRSATTVAVGSDAAGAKERVGATPSLPSSDGALSASGGAGVDRGVSTVVAGVWTVGVSSVGSGSGAGARSGAGSGVDGSPLGTGGGAGSGVGTGGGVGSGVGTGGGVGSGVGTGGGVGSGVGTGGGAGSGVGTGGVAGSGVGTGGAVGSGVGRTISGVGAEAGRLTEAPS